MSKNTTGSLVQADINDVLDNMAARNATLTRELAISQAQLMSLQRDVATLQRRVQELEAKQSETSNQSNNF